MRRSWPLVLVLLVAGCVQFKIFLPEPRVPVTRFANPIGVNAGDCTTTDCDVIRAVEQAVCGDTVRLRDGVYKGARYMLDFWSSTSPSAILDGKTCAAGTPITIEAQNDGGVFIDGEFVRYPFQTAHNAGFIFQGFDAGNSIDTAPGMIWEITNSQFKRICFSNMKNTNPSANGHVLWVFAVTNSLFEDICAFGFGRNTFIDFNNSGGNTFRRMWLRHEGYWTQASGNAGTPPIQLGYGNPQTNRLENVIAILQTREQMATNGTCGTFGGCARGLVIRDATPGGSTGYKIHGFINYAEDNSRIPLDAHSYNTNNANPSTQNDIFIDASALPTNLPGISNTNAASLMDRVTVIRGATAPASSIGSGVTNFNEGTDKNSLPNFYTGSFGGAQGARNCYEYTNGVLGSTTATQGLWPWRMDARIKAALARARAAGTGGGALQGSAGAGYADGTVTSEIVARYGPIPAACNRSGTFTPSFPVVTDFPSTPILDSFDGANGALGANWTNVEPGGTPFIRQGNQAVGPSPAAGNFARMQWNAAAFAGAHEAYATWTTAPLCCTLLSFGGTAGSVNGQWRVYTEPSGGNSTLRVARIDGGGTATTILGPIDLGTAIGANQLLGVRVSSLQTISLYWKYSDGNTYRIGSVIDTNLPSANAAIGFAGGENDVTVNDFGGGTCCGGTVSPANIGRFGTLFPKQ